MQGKRHLRGEFLILLRGWGRLMRRGRLLELSNRIDASRPLLVSLGNVVKE
jgi:hypothetical protein